MTLENGELHIAFGVPACESTMQELCLRSMTVADLFFHNLAALLPLLTELSLSDCNSPWGTSQDLQAHSTLRWASFLETCGDLLPEVLLGLRVSCLA